jgi:hypothetical protein
MKGARLIAIAATIAALSFASGRASTYITLDGSWWEDVPSDSKADVAAGMENAYTRGWVAGAAYAAGAITAAVGKRTHDLKAAIAFVQPIGDRIVSDDTPNYSRTYGYYAAAISDFYESRSGVDDVRVSEVIGCLADHPLFSCDEVAKHHSPTP